MPIELAAFDMDGTLIPVESSWAEVHRHLGTSNRDSVRDFLADRIDDREFIRTDVRLWRSRQPELTVEKIRHILNGVPLMPGAAELFLALRQHGVRTAIVSGGLDLLAERIGRELGVDEVLANGLLAGADGRPTGEGVVRVPIKGKEGVLATLQQRWGVERSRTASVGNSEFDVGLFRRSRIGVAFLPSDHLVRSAATHVVGQPDLRLLLPILLDDADAAGRSALSP